MYVCMHSCMYAFRYEFVCTHIYIHTYEYINASEFRYIRSCRSDIMNSRTGERGSSYHGPYLLDINRQMHDIVAKASKFPGPARTYYLGNWSP